MATPSCTTFLVLALCVACSSSTPVETVPDASAGANTDPQRPPTSARDVMAWLDLGYYKTWRCEPDAHASRSPSPHGRNRICNNDTIRDAAGSGAYPVGAASVKEMVDSRGAIIGYNVYRKLSEGSDGSHWYWFEAFSGSVTVDGTGGSNVPRAACVTCHAGAPRDFVYTAVP